MSAASSAAVAIRSRADGTGLRAAMTKRPAQFTITAHNAAGEQVSRGGDPFVVAVRGASSVRPRVTDNEDGTYTVEYKTSVSGSYTVAVTLHGVPLPHSPYSVQVMRPAPLARRCVLRGAGLLKGVAREPESFQVEFIDAFGDVRAATALCRPHARAARPAVHFPPHREAALRRDARMLPQPLL